MAKIRKPKSLVIKDVDGDTIELEISKQTGRLCISVYQSGVATVVFGSVAKIRRIAAKLNQIADWMEAGK